MLKIIVLKVIFLFVIVECQDDKEDIKNYSSLEDPFRMQKCNLLWTKARTKLSEKKLESLYSALKIQDKNELTLKKIKSEGGDKDGSKENEVRKKFNNILVSFGLGGTPESLDQAEIGKSSSKTLFKDKKLQRLWEKAEQAGLNAEEMIALQDEFKHHQRKVDEYHTLLDMAGNENSPKYNEVKVKLQQEEFDIRNTNEISKRGKDLKEDYDRLHRLATNRGEEAEFEEPKVAGLWKLAMNSDFTPIELESIREELIHYQKRLEKMHFLQRELSMVDERHGGRMVADDEDEKTEGRKLMDRKLAKHLEAVSKLHESLETKIMSRHNEL